MERKGRFHEDGLYHYHGDRPDLKSLGVTCSTYLKRWCSACGERTYQQFIELRGRRNSPIRLWSCGRCRTSTRTNSRP